MNSNSQIESSSIDFVNPRYKGLVNISVAATGLAIGAVFTPW